MYKVLLVDDDPEILEFLTYNFKKNNFVVASAQNRREAVELAEKWLPDIILMDMMMPVMDGVEACQMIRSKPKISKTIVIMVSARAEDYSIIAGLEGGADDYVVKPIKFKILIKKIEAHLSRFRKLAGLEMEAEYEDAKLKINRQTHQIWFEGGDVQLANKEFELVSLLTTRPERVFTRDEILDRLWSSNAFVGERTIDVHIRKLRIKMPGIVIKTVSGVGYKYLP